MTTTLSIEIGAARAYATTEGSAQGDAADLAEIKVREYAGHHGTPERETTIRLATDAAEQAAESCTIRGCDRLRSGAPDHDGDLCGDHRDAEVALGRGPVAS